ncbi:MAG: DNA gyrase subunit A [Verrucomicrobiota bacterium]
MAEDSTPQDPDFDNILPINVADEMKNSFLDYSMSVIISRALPDARDGLKPSQRRLLYAMYNDLNLLPNRKFLKCARIVGDTMGKYHPHGDQAIYPTLVNMAQPWSMRDPLVHGQGNFGSPEGDNAAAMRYTEAKLTHLGAALMLDLDKDTVDKVKNYDESNEEPVVLPAAFPNLLVNGGTGIAVGMATNSPPHNLGEVIDGICETIDNPKITNEELQKIIKGPDFPTGCTILGSRGIKSYFETGRGQIKVRGTAEIAEKGNHEQIIITQVPFYVRRDKLHERIAELTREKVLPEISAIRDESDENTRLVIDLKRDSQPQVVLNNIYKHTSLETSFSANMLAIDNRRPKLLSVRDAINCYIEHRRDVILRRTRYLLKQAEDKAERLEAFLLALGNIDDFIKMIRDSKSRDEARDRIKAYDFSPAAAEALGVLIRDQPSLKIKEGRYVFTDRQVNAILDLRLYQLTALEQDKTKNDYNEVIEEIKDYLDILNREERVLAIIKEELIEIKDKHATPRRTGFAADEGDMNLEDLIANEGAIVTVSHKGYIKRTPAEEYRVQNRGGKGLKGMETRDAMSEEDEDDFVEQLFAATTHDYLLFFTNTGRVFLERVFSIPEGSRTAKGRSVKNLLNFRPEEKIASVLRIEGDPDGDRAKTFSPGYHVIFATKTGIIKKTNLSDFKNIRKDGIIAINIDEGNELIGCRLTSGEDEIVLVTNQGMSLRCSEKDFRDQGRATRGVTGIRPGKDGDFVVGIAIVDPDATLLVASMNGIGKRTPFEDYRLQNRGGKGIITMKVTDKTGLVVSAVAVNETDELMLMTSTGQSVRIRVTDVRQAGRNTQGVKLMTLAEGETIQDIARVAADPDEALEELVSDDGTIADAEAGDSAPESDPPQPPTSEEDPEA